jgi:hypothetical protein
MTDTVRPHLNRRSHQQALARQKRRRRKRRLARARRIRVLKAIRSIRFWIRCTAFAAGFLALAFWARFAVVYDIPLYAERGALANVDMYITVKPWWFGPPLFDLGKYGVSSIKSTEPYQVLLDELGKYAVVVESPQFVWVSRH